MQQKQIAKRKNKKPKQPSVFGLTQVNTIFPSRFRGKMTYSTNQYVTSAMGVAAVQTFRLNSVFDPDYTGTGRTAAGYAQLSQLYGRYRVLSVRVTVTWVSPGANPQFCFVAVNPLNAVTPDLSVISAQRNSWVKAIGSKDGNATITHTFGGKIGKFYGVPESQVRDEDDFAGLVGYNPNNVVYAHIGCLGMTTAPSAQIQCNVVFDVAWSLPKELSMT